MTRAAIISLLIGVVHLSSAPAPFQAPAPSADAAPAVLTGLDVLRADGFARLRGKRIGLLTNPAGRSNDGTSTIDLLYDAADVQLVALFSPEHGIQGTFEAPVPSSVDSERRLVIHSLYGKTFKPTPDMLKGVDCVVVDLQDVGARFYTYVATTANLMEEAAKLGIEVLVLDRPNPINGDQIEGALLDPDLIGLSGPFPMPIRHGLTLGELAGLINTERKLGCRLVVVPMRHWRRAAWFDHTGLMWTNPSPNMRTMNAATLYPGIGSIEFSNISVGRGTDTPFEMIGAPWIDGIRLATALNSRHLPGIRFYPISFTPTANIYARERCQGVFILVADRGALRPVRVGLEIASALSRLHGSNYKIRTNDQLFGSRAGVTRLLAGEDPAAIAASWAADEAQWREKRAKYLLYQ